MKNYCSKIVFRLYLFHTYGGSRNSKACVWISLVRVSTLITNFCIAAAEGKERKSIYNTPFIHA